MLKVYSIVQSSLICYIPPKQHIKGHSSLFKLKIEDNNSGGKCCICIYSVIRIPAYTKLRRKQPQYKFYCHKFKTAKIIPLVVTLHQHFWWNGCAIMLTTKHKDLNY